MKASGPYRPAMTRVRVSSGVVIKFSARDEGCEKAIEPLHVHGLGHEDGAFRQATFGGDFFLRQGRNDQASHALELGRVFECAQQLKSIDTWHVQVGDQHIGLDACHVDQGLESGRHGRAVDRHFATVAKISHHVAGDRVIFDQQNPQTVLPTFNRAHQHVVLFLVVPNGGHGDAAMTPLGFPGLQLVFFDQSLDGSHGQSEQFGCIGGAAVVFWRVGRVVCLHDFILMIKVRNGLKNSTLIRAIKQIDTI